MFYSRFLNRKYIILIVKSLYTVSTVMDETIIPIRALYISYEIGWCKIAEKQSLLLSFFREMIGDIIAKYYIVSFQSRSGYEQTEVLLGFRSKWTPSLKNINSCLAFQGIIPEGFAIIEITKWSDLIEGLKDKVKQIGGISSVLSNDDTELTPVLTQSTHTAPVTLAQRLSKDQPKDQPLARKGFEYPKPHISIPISDDNTFKFAGNAVNLEYFGQCKISDALKLVHSHPDIQLYSIMWNVQSKVLYVLLKFFNPLKTTDSKMFDLGVSGHPKWTYVNTKEHYRNVIRSHQNHSIPIIKESNDPKVHRSTCSFEDFDNVYKALLPQAPEKTGKSITFMIRDSIKICYTIHQTSR
ncbi:Hypothetical protein POVR1_LOCUS372 [uncultured virus]|nr:Hypothetical protein POVR1_LOCUS372 [uncultured virus]